EVTGETAVRLEPLTVVRDVQRQLTVVTAKPDLDPRRTGVFYDVVQRLLRDAIDRLLYRERGLRLFAQHRRDGEPVAGFEGRRLLGQRRDETFHLQRLGAQLEDQRAHLRQPCFGQREDVVERLGEWPRRGVAVQHAVEQRARRASAQRDAVQRLRDGVMQLPREFLALFQRRRPFGFLVEPRILQRDCRLV